MHFLPILWPRLTPSMEDILAAGEKPAMKLVDEVKREHFGLEDIGKPTNDQQSTVVNLEKGGLSSEQPIFVNAESKIKDNTKGKRLSVNGEAVDERPAQARGAWVFGYPWEYLLSSFCRRSGYSFSGEPFFKLTKDKMTVKLLCHGRFHRFQWNLNHQEVAFQAWNYICWSRFNPAQSFPFRLWKQQYMQSNRGIDAGYDSWHECSGLFNGAYIVFRSMQFYQGLSCEIRGNFEESMPSSCVLGDGYKEATMWSLEQQRTKMQIYKPSRGSFSQTLRSN